MTIIAIVSCDDLKRTDLKDISVFRPMSNCLARQLNLGNLNTPSIDLIQFYSWFNSSFLFLLVGWEGMVMYDNEFETKENKN